MPSVSKICGILFLDDNAYAATLTMSIAFELLDQELLILHMWITCGKSEIQDLDLFCKQINNALRDCPTSQE